MANWMSLGFVDSSFKKKKYYSFYINVSVMDFAKYICCDAVLQSTRAKPLQNKNVVHRRVKAETFLLLFIGRFACMIQSEMAIYSWTLLVFSLLFGFNWIIHYAELNQRVSLTKRRVFVRGTENRATSLVWWICGCERLRSCSRYRDKKKVLLIWL